MEGPRPEQIRVLFRWFKEGPPGAIPVEVAGSPRGRLRAVTWEDAGSPPALDRLASWHAAAFAPLPRGARPWLTEILESNDRVLFWVNDLADEPVGLVGLSNLDASLGTIALSDVLAGEEGQGGLMSEAIDALTAWVRQSLRLDVWQPLRAAA